jgi:hypothetical protein
MKVFISSLISGMEAERASVRHAVELLSHQAVMAEEFGAKANSPQVVCLQGVRASDAVVLVLGHRYGAVQPSGLSATHEEFREARGTKPVLVFIQAGAPEPAQEAFIREVSGWADGVFRREFETAARLGELVVTALHEFELAHATGPVDADALRQRALELLPPVERHSSNARLSLAVAAGPAQSILRPSQMEDDTLARDLQQRALFGRPPLFDRTVGMEAGLERGALVVRQDVRNGSGARIALWETGDLLVEVPPSAPRTRHEMSLLMLIEEDLTERLHAALAYAVWLLDHVDPTQKLTHVALAARLSASSSYFGWRTRAEHAARPNTASLAGFGRDDRREEPVLLTPAHRPRAALKMDAPNIVEDLLTLLRRAWRE